jgi:2-furoate---CoA ligase
MLDVGTALIQAAERSPHATALVDGDWRYDYATLLDEAAKLAGGLGELGLRRGDRVISIMQNRAEAAVLHWACQLAGVVIVPLNWRIKADELDYCIENAEAGAIAFEGVSAAAVAGAGRASGLPSLGIGDDTESSHGWAELTAGEPLAGLPCADAEDVSVMLYTSGTTGRPKGVPRRHRAERAAAIAHVAQNCLRRGEVTLGVMPLYHTMGVRALLAMALVDGRFVAQARFDAGRSLELIEAERVTSLYLVPTLYHDMLAHERFAKTDISSVHKLGFAGAAMTDGLLKRLDAAFEPELFVNHYGSSEIYTFTIEQDAAAKPGSAGRAGINQRIRVIRLGETAPDALAAAGDEGQIAASLAGDESFEGYWRRPDADEKALLDGWYLTGDTGFFDEDGDLFVTGRVDDMIITGGENVTPGEIESVLSLHPGVAEVAVAGLPDERWGQRVTGFVVRASGLAGERLKADDLDALCRESDLANFKRPREYVFVREIPKSPVGKVLRRLLVSGDDPKGEDSSR